MFKSVIIVHVLRSFVVFRFSVSLAHGDDMTARIERDRQRTCFAKTHNLYHHIYL